MAHMCCHAPAGSLHWCEVAAGPAAAPHCSESSFFFSNCWGRWAFSSQVKGHSFSCGRAHHSRGSENQELSLWDPACLCLILYASSPPHSLHVVGTPMSCIRYKDNSLTAGAVSEVDVSSCTGKVRAEAWGQVSLPPQQASPSLFLLYALLYSWKLSSDLISMKSSR